MITLNFLLCANGAILDQNSNRVSLFEIIDDLTTENFPLFFHRFEVICSLRRDREDDAQLRPRLVIKNNENTLGEFNIDVNFQQSLTNRSIIRIAGLAIPSPGKVSIEVNLDDRLIGSYFFILEKAPIQPSIIS